MRLSKIEINGFKAFKDKLTLQVPAGIISIVGPNGCGKSNIVDCIKWALGEQNPRHLRAKTMEDIIFAGTSEFPATGMAEVSLTFEQSAVPFPEPYSNLNELVITRRLFRSGESEYMINKAQCRLKDISDITIDTGVGQRFYGLIEQGMVESYMHFKPEEKRLIFEEVAGTAKYRLRKKATLQKLDLAKLNLERVDDIIAEVENRYNDLEKEAARAVEYKKIFDELKRLELYRNSLNYRKIRHKLEEKLIEYEEINKWIGEKELETGTLEADLEVNRNRLFMIEKEHDELLRALQSITESIGRIEKDYYAVKETKSLRVAKLNELNERSAEITANRSALENEAKGFENDAAGFEQSIRELDATLREQETAEDALRQRSMNLTNALSALQKEIINDKNQQAYLSSQVAYEEKLYEDTQKKMGLVSEEIIRTDEEAAGVKDSLSEVLQNLQEMEGRKTELENFITQAHENIQSEKRLAQDLRKNAQDKDLKKERLNGAYNSTKKFFEDYKGFSGGAQHVLKNFGKDEVMGTIVESVDVKDEFLTPFENYLRDRLEVILVKDRSVAKKAIEYLKQNNLGSCFFLPVAMAAGSTATTGGILDYISISDSHRPTLSDLFSKVRLVDSIDEALDLYEKGERGFHYLTKGGEYLDDMGVIYGGSRATHNPLIVEKHRLKELEAELKQLEKEVAALKEQIKQKDDHILSLETKLASKREELAHLNVEISSERVEQKHREEEIKRIESKKDNLRAEMKNLELNLASYLKKKEDLILNADELEKTLADKEESVVQKNTELETVRLEMDHLRDQLTQLKVSHAEKRRNYQHIVENMQKLRGQAQVLTGTLEGLAREAEALRKIDLESDLILNKSEEDLKRLRSEETATLDKAKFGEESISAIRQETFDKDKALNSLRSELEKKRKAASNLKDATSEQTLQLRLIEERIREKYFVDITRLFEEYLTWDVKESECTEPKIEELQRQLREMGEVNLLSIDEFEEVKNRFEFLKKQKADLAESIESLNSAIDRINKISIEMFTKSLKNIEENFDRLIKRFFNGGRGRIILTQEDNILESGVELAVEPPHKQLKSTELLSGGEKALVTLALIFAFYMQKPSPFCILDEVDAPLDDANCLRYKELLKEMTRFSQFMVVTHNKNVMDCATILYGVTMETPGVSKIVSVRTNREE